MNKLHIGKIKILLLFCVSLIFAAGLFSLKTTEVFAKESKQTSSFQTEQVYLSQMSDDECIAFVNANDINIPNDFANSPELGKIIREIILTVENDFNCEFAYSYYVTYNFATEIKEAVVGYYQETDTPQRQTKSDTYANYVLEDSILWSNTGYLDYNCYAYAINRNEKTSVFGQYQLGYFSNTSVNINLSIEDMANVVKKDLETIGFGNISITTYIPSLGENERLICIRKGSRDYHFMKYDKEENAWFHKPGTSAILKYKYTPEFALIWTNEGVNENGVVNPTTTYDSTIYFIKYSYDSYKVTLRARSDFTTEREVAVVYGEALPEIDMFAPKITGYAFDGYYSSIGKCYYKMALLNDQQTADMNNLNEAIVEKIVPADRAVWDIRKNVELNARWEENPLECDYSYACYFGNEFLGRRTAHLTHGASKISAGNISGYAFSHFVYMGKTYTENDYIPVSLYRGLSGNVLLKETLVAYYNEGPCVVEGTLITLADGTQVPVEKLTGNEQLLVWNMYTGEFDTAQILFIDSDPKQEYEVINLYFSDGTSVKVVLEHAFWDTTLNRYVYLDKNASQYIGHNFNKQTTNEKGEQVWTEVELKNVTITQENTTVYSPITCEHYCYYVNGMLSMPGGIEGLINIFDVNADTMKYDTASFNQDITTYGLFSYDELSALIPISEEIFNALNAKYLKVAIGKGLITIDELKVLYNRYAEYLV